MKGERESVCVCVWWRGNKKNHPWEMLDEDVHEYIHAWSCLPKYQSYQSTYSCCLLLKQGQKCSRSCRYISTSLEIVGPFTKLERYLLW